MTKLLDRANAARTDATAASPYDLWKLADRQAAGADSLRRRLYRHALVHAGYLVQADGTPYPACPECHETLG